MKKTFLISCLLVASFPVMAAYTGHVYVGTFIKYYKISQLIHTQIIAN